MFGAIREYLRPELVWFLVGLGLLLLEFVMPGLIVFFFGLGACIVAMVCLVTEASINTQLMIFIGSSILSLLLLRSWLKGVVKEKIVPKLGGKVEFHGTNWAAQADEQIEAGTVVEIVAKDNITLKVKAL